MPDITKAIAAWNNNLNNMPHEIAMGLYKSHLLQEDLLRDVRQTTDELFSVANYYQYCTNVYIQKGTNIITIFEPLMPEVDKIKRLITQEEGVNRNSITTAEQYFITRNMSPMSLKNEAKKNFETKKRVLENQLLKKSQTQLVGTSFPSGPNKNNKKNDDDESEKDLKKTPDFITENRVPIDKETILHDSSFQKTNIPKVKGATVYSKGDFLYHRDTFHRGKGAHLEVYTQQGKHLGEADIFTGKLIPDTLDKTKRLII